MSENIARRIYEEAAEELFTDTPPPMEELLNNATTRYRVGKIITDAVIKMEFADE
jgi:hypothetical protein